MLRWQGAEENEVGIDAESGATLVRIDPKYYRPTEVELLLGDATKAKNILGWTPSTDYDVSYFTLNFANGYSHNNA
jgi:GDPmannose 4,6-dehydratase